MVGRCDAAHAPRFIPMTCAGPQRFQDVSIPIPSPPLPSILPVRPTGFTASGSHAYPLQDADARYRTAGPDVYTLAPGAECPDEAGADIGWVAATGRRSTGQADETAPTADLLALASEPGGRVFEARDDSVFRSRRVIVSTHLIRFYQVAFMCGIRVDLRCIRLEMYENSSEISTF